MSDEDTSILSEMSLEVAPHEMITHTILIAVVTRPGSWDDEVRIAASPHTSRIVALGAISDALEQVRPPGIYGENYDDEEDDE